MEFVMEMWKQSVEGSVAAALCVVPVHGSGLSNNKTQHYYRDFRDFLANIHGALEINTVRL